MFKDSTSAGERKIALTVCLTDSFVVECVDLDPVLVVPDHRLRNFSTDLDGSFRLILPTTVTPTCLYDVRILSSSNESVCRIGFDGRFVNCTAAGSATFEVEYQTSASDGLISGNFTVELATVDKCAPPGCNGALSLDDLEKIDEELFGEAASAESGTRK